MARKWLESAIPAKSEWSSWTRLLWLTDEELSADLNTRMSYRITINEIEFAKNLQSFWIMSPDEIARQRRLQPGAWGKLNTLDAFHGFAVKEDRSVEDYQFVHAEDSTLDIEDVFAMVATR